jgi:C2 domain
MSLPLLGILCVYLMTTRVCVLLPLEPLMEISALIRSTFSEANLPPPLHHHHHHQSSFEYILHYSTGDGIGKSDPYVKLELVKDGFGPFDKSFGEQVSSHKSNTVNPEYHETFSWQAPEDITGLVVNVVVMDDDIGRDDKIGKCSIKLADIDGDLSSFRAVERNLDNKWFRKDAKIYLKIKFEA